jgi:hypothetical protein
LPSTDRDQASDTITPTGGSGLNRQHDAIRGEDFRSACDALGLAGARRTGKSDGLVRLYPVAGGNGFQTDDVLGCWAEAVLAKNADVSRKLEACAVGERHAFIWVTFDSFHLVQYLLEMRHHEPIPERCRRPRCQQA